MQKKKEETQKRNEERFSRLCQLPADKKLTKDDVGFASKWEALVAPDCSSTDQHCPRCNRRHSLVIKWFAAKKFRDRKCKLDVWWTCDEVGCKAEACTFCYAKEANFKKNHPCRGSTPMAAVTPPNVL